MEDSNQTTGQKAWSQQLTLRERLFRAPWVLIRSLFRAAYGLHMEGAERIPSEGPFILILTEPNLLAMVTSHWLTLLALDATRRSGNSETVAYMQEDLFGLSYFKSAVKTSREKVKPLRPTSAGSLTLNLLDGFHALRRRGIVVMNPEGDATWDGRPLKMGHSTAWLALHTAAPIVPALVTAGSYDIWPRWRMTPSRKGRLAVRVGEPLRLCETPLLKVSDEDLERASQQILAEHIALRYGPGGLEEWAGPARRNGAPLEEPPQLMPPTERTIARGERRNLDISVIRRGIPQLLWRCPVCGTNDALREERPLFRARRLTCLACATRWEVRRVIGHDFRLKVVEGPEDVLGLDMALTRWYDEMKRTLRPTPLQVSGVELLPGEEVYLEARDASMRPHVPNALFEGWSQREAPQAQGTGEFVYADWGTLGTGRLLLTNQRLIWQGTDRAVDFLWPSVNSLSVNFYTALAVQYGMAHYRVGLGGEPALKWLTHADVAARQAPGARRVALKTARY